MLEVLAEDAAAGGARQLLPVGLAEPDGRDRAVEVLERAAARLGPHEFDRAEIGEQADVVADPPEGQVELAREHVGTRGAPVEHSEQSVTKRVADRSQERFVKFARALC